MYDDIAYRKDDIQKTQCICIGIRHMYDDIAYRKDDIQTRSVYVLEYAICMTTLRIEKTTFRNVVYMFQNTPYVRRHFVEKIRYLENMDATEK